MLFGSAVNEASSVQGQFLVTIFGNLPEELLVLRSALAEASDKRTGTLGIEQVIQLFGI